MLWNVVRRLQHVICWAMAVASHNGANFIAGPGMSIYMVDRIFVCTGAVPSFRFVLSGRGISDVFVDVSVLSVGI